MSAIIIPVLPTRVVKNSKPAKTVTELVNGMRQGGNNPPQAEGLERHQDYLDALSLTVGDINKYLQSLNVYINNSAVVTTGVTINGVPVDY